MGWNDAPPSLPPNENGVLTTEPKDDIGLVFTFVGMVFDEGKENRVEVLEVDGALENMETLPPPVENGENGIVIAVVRFVDLTRLDEVPNPSVPPLLLVPFVIPVLFPPKTKLLEGFVFEGPVWIPNMDVGFGLLSPWKVEFDIDDDDEEENVCEDGIPKGTFVETGGNPVV